jgi:endonuclease III
MLIGFAVWVTEEFGGTVPQDPKILLSFWGISRKILMLLMQDGGFNKPAFIGIVGDSHFGEACTHKQDWVSQRKQLRTKWQRNLNV